MGFAHFSENNLPFCRRNLALSVGWQLSPPIEKSKKEAIAPQQKAETTTGT